MKIYLGNLFLICLLAPLAMPANTIDESSLKAITQGSNKFAISLYQTLAKNRKDNVVVSPISLQMVLALTGIGGKGQVAQEISSALGLPEDKDKVLQGHKLLLQELKHPVLNMVNKMFVEKTAPVKQEFQTAAKDYFFSAAESLDFLHNNEAARQTINKWVEDNTNHKIKELLAKDTLAPDTRVVLTNAVHFKAKWQTPFKEKDTSLQDFYVSPTEKVQVPMMHLEGLLGLKHNSQLGAKILELPYEGHTFSMYIILPDAIDGLAQVEAKLASLNLTKEFSGVAEIRVALSLPKFKIETTMDLKETLIEMGMPTLFSSPDLSGISNEPLEVSKVIQKAFIEVNEEGTEAAAGTAVIMRDSLMPENEFLVNHPSLFMIINIKTNIPLFIASMKNPAQ